MGRRDVGKAVFVAVVRLHGCLDVCSLGMHLGRTCLLCLLSERNKVRRASSSNVTLSFDVQKLACE
jgi:hypothetical protein